jgi:REP element-mobilizing transposase RayT
MPAVDPDRRRKPTRLRGYDYRTPALYHVVTTTQHGVCRFGEVCDSLMHPNPIGRMVGEIWHAIPEQFPTVSLDTSIVMPNHLHGIIFIEPQPAGVLARRHHEMVQDRHHGTLQPRREESRLATLRWAPLASQLLRPHRSR